MVCCVVCVALFERLFVLFMEGFYGYVRGLWVRLLQLGDSFGFSGGFEGFEEEFESVSLHDSIELVDCECNSVIGDSVLRKVIGTDSF